MKQLTGNQVRQMFLDFFASKNHMIEPGASLVPINDPSLLWINSGVAALKKYLDGREKPASNRIANAQKCIRTNDIENVGKTSRHHTFFEMLGNWSIGDYFKRESLKMSWEFLTSPEWIGFDPDRIYVTMYPDDNETYDIWTKEIGLDPSHILKSYDNYWQIGEGPCGPDSEIYYDRGPKYDPEGLGEKLFFEEMENDRYVELWNNVFSQYDAKEGVDRKDFKELPQKNIDTGMGLERLVCMIQDGETNFDTDLFLPYIHEVEKYTSVKYAENKMAFRVIADHIRTCVFALSDGATFSNEGRGYVLRRVLRRAMRYARNIGINKPFLYELVDVVCENMKDFYPYLLEKKGFVKKLIKKEEESFIQTLANGEKILNQELDNVKNGVLSGEVIFKLYDTYGFPKEMTIESAEERGIKCDIEGFEKCMLRQKEMARNAREDEQSMNSQSVDLLNLDTEFDFTGYGKQSDKGQVVALFENGKRVDVLNTAGEVVFDHSCFYATSGGQIADTGLVYNENIKAVVKDVNKAPNGQFLHHVVIENGEIRVGDVLSQEINKDDRRAIKANHSSLHLLQSALRQVVGTHVAQAGSYVCKDYARFDFSHYEKISSEDLDKVEKLVNSWIGQELPIVTEVMDIEEAKKTDAIALFDEKYGDKVRVVRMGDVSTEFCGGTHASNTAELGVFKIVSEESVGSGIRRITVKTKEEAYNDFSESFKHLNQIADMLGLKSSQAIDAKINSLLQNINELNAELKKTKTMMLNYEADEMINHAETKDGIKYLFVKLDNSDVNVKDFAVTLRNKLVEGVVLLANVGNEKVTFACAVSKEAISRGIKAGVLVKEAALMCDGKGGGKDDLAQSGGKNLHNVDEILNTIKNELLNAGN
ncbi:MAG: alanine--tRNA ligase [Erysipelotrichaceae bacterium]|nr:alanine--tRNA ligase [Erysipelotrichaceae bacterium]